MNELLEKKNLAFEYSIQVDEKNKTRTSMI